MKFNIILADPPWSYYTWTPKGTGRNADQHYQTQSLDWIASLPVQSICADDCVLFLWATWPNLEAAFNTIKEWGFTYKTLGFDWCKLTSTGDHWHIGNGYYTRANTEPCLLATRGKILERLDMGVKQLIATREAIPDSAIVAPLGKHSAKPAEQYRRIDRLFGTQLPRAELFARKRRAGWVSLGRDLSGLDMVEELIVTAAATRPYIPVSAPSGRPVQDALAL